MNTQQRFALKLRLTLDNFISLFRRGLKTAPYKSRLPCQTRILCGFFIWFVMNTQTTLRVEVASDRKAQRIQARSICIDCAQRTKQSIGSVDRTATRKCRYAKRRYFVRRSITLSRYSVAVLNRSLQIASPLPDPHFMRVFYLVCNEHATTLCVEVASDRKAQGIQPRSICIDCAQRTKQSIGSVDRTATRKCRYAKRRYFVRRSENKTFKLLYRLLYSAPQGFLQERGRLLP